MPIAIEALPDCNGVDSCVPAVARWPGSTAVSMTGMQIFGTGALQGLARADAAVPGSGRLTVTHAAHERLLAAPRADERRRLPAGQCSGAVPATRWGQPAELAACTDTRTRPLSRATGVAVLEQLFHASGIVAIAAGCLAWSCLGARIIRRGAVDDARAAVGAQTRARAQAVLRAGESVACRRPA